METTEVTTFEIEQVRGITVVRFTISELTESNFEAVADELWERLLNRRTRHVVVDLGSIRRIDDMGLATVQSLHDSIEEFNGIAILCRLNSSVMSALSDSGLSKLLHIRTSLNEAIWTF
jgi:anti-anti-sigma factor